MRCTEKIISVRRTESSTVDTIPCCYPTLTCDWVGAQTSLQSYWVRSLTWMSRSSQTSQIHWVTRVEKIVSLVSGLMVTLEERGRAWGECGIVYCVHVWGSDVCCLLWINKARDKEKTYIWVSVRWVLYIMSRESENKRWRLTPSTGPIFEVRLNQKNLGNLPRERELVQKDVRFLGFESFLWEKKSFKVLSTGLQYLVCGCTMITFLFVPKFLTVHSSYCRNLQIFSWGRLGLLACQRRKIHETSSFSWETYIQFWKVARSELLDIFFKQHPHHQETFETAQGWRWRQGRTVDGTGPTVRKTRILVVFQRVRKSSLDWRVRCVSCLRTKLHMSEYLFVHISMHVTYSNKILGNETVTKEARWGKPVQATCTCPWKKIFSSVRAQETQWNHRTKTLLWVWMHAQWDCGFEYVEKHDGLGSVWNCKVYPPGFK